MLKRMWSDDEGVLTFEWILLLTLLVIGVIGGIAGIRDALIHEGESVAMAVVSLDQSYDTNGFTNDLTTGSGPPYQGPLAVSVGPFAGVDSGACTSSASSSGFWDFGEVGSGRAVLNDPQQTILADPAGGDGLCTVN